MGKIIRIGTRESQLAVWQAEQVKDLLAKNGFAAELIFIKSEGDVDLKTPLYEMGVQGVFTRSLDTALLNNRIDVAVHSMKDVPTQLPKGIIQAAVLKRGPIHDLLVFKNTSSQNKYSIFNLPTEQAGIQHSTFIVATSSIRRKAQWLNKFPNHQIENLRGNVNTRLRKLQEENWDAAIFAQAGLERINLRPANSIVLDWMLPAPAQGAIMVVCREDDQFSFQACDQFNDAHTAQCTKIERDFLRTLLGGCSTPISAYAEIKNDKVYFKGNIFSLDGNKKVEIEKAIPVNESHGFGIKAAEELLANGGNEIADSIRKNSISLNDEV
ncbi:MAG TPA: hydroxymethylbilane synthase [Chitinophagaceae bacterium]|nr:hydroxymethylbilane synthase [Chitinophagaceae bacterium]